MRRYLPVPFRAPTTPAGGDGDLHHNRVMIYVGIGFITGVVILTALLVLAGRVPAAEYVTIAGIGVSQVSGFITGFLAGRDREREAARSTRPTGG